MYGPVIQSNASLLTGHFAPITLPLLSYCLLRSTRFAVEKDSDWGLSSDYAGDGWRGDNRYGGGGSAPTTSFMLSLSPSDHGIKDIAHDMHPFARPSMSSIRECTNLSAVTLYLGASSTSLVESSAIISTLTSNLAMLHTNTVNSSPLAETRARFLA
ncbi:uncharacterized protein PHACADRAFT_30848 [Phanerochaete carnosa HHB-10118-sp]|uniref:Uncharacterized protein n=1 Tax=Phanerochaete carnosa (strain HHB-10118-sp) TaxID=650164 RepID=K5WPS0_PHACS|nr:uncharacterized protein PHACADRAFT_30848 [Phanerochaete carnosa HHB-10118-sp]EKM52312.1 hypothetical protein PHACADRAFT_30848 [Phanerochaete carnosa HHB-10118-sp]